MDVRTTNPPWNVCGRCWRKNLSAEVLEVNVSESSIAQRGTHV